MLTAVDSVVLFDLDGVLLDSSSAYRHAWGQWAAERSVSFEALRQAAYGRRPIDIIHTAAPHLDPAAELAAFRVLLAAAKPVNAMAGAADVLHALPSGRWAIVTSGERAEVLRRLAAAELPAPAVTVCAEDVEVGKPDPAGYRLAARRLGVTPGRCVVVEDSPAGVTAGRRAGMEVVAVCTTHQQGELVSSDRVYASLADASPYLLTRAR